MKKNIYENKTVKEILRNFLHKVIPNKHTNIFYLMFNGIQHMFEIFEYRLNIYKRERNILTAQNIHSIRYLASQNGIEPQLKLPSNGILNLVVNSKLFGRVGYPIYIKPNTEFTNKQTKLIYTYLGNKILKINNTNTLIPVSEGIMEEIEFEASDNDFTHIYLSNENIAEGSINVWVDNIKYNIVKSLIDGMDNCDNNTNSNTNNFLVKFSTNEQKPIIIYLRGNNIIKDKSIIKVRYQLTNGSLGNISSINEFEINSIYDSVGNLISLNEDDIQIYNVNGFYLGSDGTNIDVLKSSLGYNHGITVLFDNISYRNFINRFSTICLNRVENDLDYKQINNIYLYKRLIPNKLNIRDWYEGVIYRKEYELTKNDIENLSKHISEHEYCLSSHNIYNVGVIKYSIQIELDKKYIEYGINIENDISNHIYNEFAKFLYDRTHQININKIFDGTVFDKYINDINVLSISNEEKITIIKQNDYLPILSGDFFIVDDNGNSHQILTGLFFWTK